VTALQPVATRYAVATVPLDHPDHRHLVVYIEARPGGRWVVTCPGDTGEFLNTDGAWDWGAEDSDEWRTRHWHTWDVAVELARAACAEFVP
jgi:hypothetical protein